MSGKKYERKLASSLRSNAKGGAKELRRLGAPRAAAALSTVGTVVPGISNALPGWSSGLGGSFFDRASGGGKKKRRRKGSKKKRGGKKKPRSAAQKRATAKMLKANKRGRGRKRKGKGKRKAKR